MQPPPSSYQEKMMLTKEFISIFTLRGAIRIARPRWTLKKFSTYLRIRLRAFCSSTSSGSHLTPIACKHTNELLSKSFLAIMFVTSSWGYSTDDVTHAKIFASTQRERTIVAENFAIDNILPDYVVVTVPKAMRSVLQKLGLRHELLKHLPFPATDSAYHDYDETSQEIDQMVEKFPDLASRISIGSSLEGRDLIGVRISASPLRDSLPPAIIIGCHHAREHLSVEVPLMLAKHLTQSYQSD